MKGLSVLQDVAATRVFRQFASKHHLVYFGSVDARSDEHHLLRGLTASTSHIDNNYTVGTFQGHDLMLVERRNAITHPGKPTRSYKWLILAVDLKRSDLPHIFFDGLHHDETFYANLKLGFAKLQDVSSLVVPLNNMRVFTSVESTPFVQSLLTPEFLMGLAGASHFDFEVNDDQVFVYSTHAASPLLLTSMLKVGMWLAEQLNARPQ